MRTTYIHWIAIAAANLAIAVAGTSAANAMVSVSTPLEVSYVMLSGSEMTLSPFDLSEDGTQPDAIEVITTSTNRTTKRRLRAAKPRHVFKKRAIRKRTTSIRSYGTATCNADQNTTSGGFGQGETLVSIEADARPPASAPNDC